MQKLLLLIALCFHLFAADALAFGEFSIGVGVSSDGINTFRVEAQKGVGPDWFESETGYLSLSLDASVDYWEKDEEDAYAAAIVPLLTYQFTSWTTIHPFIEAGVGAAYVSEKIIHDRNLGMHFQFADILGVGVYFGPQKSYGIRGRLLHYSNAGLDDHNDGVTFYTLSYQIRF